MSLKIGFIGAGNMAEAMAGSIINKGLTENSSVFISDPDDSRKKFFKLNYHINICSSNTQLINESEIIVLSVKPQIMEEVLTNSFGAEDVILNEKKLIISIAAGISCKKIEDIIYNLSGCTNKKNLPVVRVMPNTPALAGEAMSGISPGSCAEAGDISTAQKIMDSMGKSMVVDEEKMNAVTAVSGSGPAYFFLFIEALAKAGVNLGFSEEEALKLVFQTAKGAVALMEKTKEAPDLLRKKVTSKGGTTEAALNVFNEENLIETVFKAAKAAEKRADELS